MLAYLRREGVVRPSSGGRRRGQRCQYSFSDLLLLRIVADLLDKGVTISKLRTGFQRLREDPRYEQFQDLKGLFLETDGTNLYLRGGGRFFEDITKNGQFTFGFSLALDPLREQVSRRIERLVA